jgi:beta-glucosidase
MERTAMGWEVYPQAFYDLLNRLHFEYTPPKLYITENGASYPSAANIINDQHRISYLRRHLKAAHRAIQNGVPLAGYFQWSLFDNFEWAKGYKQRFGMVWVDYDTQERIPKQSARWYSDVMRDNGFYTVP